MYVVVLIYNKLFLSNFNLHKFKYSFSLIFSLDGHKRFLILRVDIIYGLGILNTNVAIN